MPLLLVLLGSQHLDLNCHQILTEARIEAQILVQFMFPFVLRLHMVIHQGIFTYAPGLGQAFY